MQGDDLRRTAYARVPAEDLRVVTGHDVVGRTGQPGDAVVPVQGALDVDDRRKRVTFGEVLKVVNGVRRQHDPASLGADPGHLQSSGVPADQIELQPRGEFDVTVGHQHGPREYPADDGHDVVDFEEVAEGLVPHGGTGSVRKLGALHDHLRTGEVRDVAGVVVVQVRQDDVPDGAVVDAQRADGVAGPDVQDAATPAAGGLVEPGIDDGDMVAAPGDPHDEVDADRTGPVAGGEEVVPRRALTAADAGRPQLPCRRCGGGRASHGRRPA